MIIIIFWYEVYESLDVRLARSKRQNKLWLGSLIKEGKRERIPSEGE